MRALIAILGLLLLAPAMARAEVTFDWVTVGDPGNACEVQPDAVIPGGCFGAVAYEYRISKYEVTNAQYAEFLNAVATTDSNGLYSSEMGCCYGGITRSGSSGSYTYSLIAGREQVPVNNVSFYDALRFANWLQNGQPTGAQDSATTEDGAYTFSGATSVGARNGGATVFLPSEDEWYKAAYYDAVSASYFDFPAGTDTQTTCTSPGAAANTANCIRLDSDLTDAGSYTGSASPVGTFDQGGNVWERNEAIIGSDRGVRGGSLASMPPVLAASSRLAVPPTGEYCDIGLRVASIPGGWVPPVPTLSLYSQLALVAGMIGVGLTMAWGSRLRRFRDPPAVPVAIGVAEADCR